MTVANSLFQAALCFLSIAALRVFLLHLDTRVSAIFMGLPIIMFPMMAIQAWYGPAITQSQTTGSIGSMTAVAGALWVLRGLGAPAPLLVLAIVASAWLAILVVIYLAALPAGVMTALILVNGTLIFTVYRKHRPVLARSKGSFTDGLLPVTVFLVAFFVIAEFIPEFVRGVFVSFPIGLLATLYFARRVLCSEAFTSFVIYTHGAITAGSMFVILVHFTLPDVPIALSLAIALAGSLLTSVLAISVWRTPGQAL